MIHGVYRYAVPSLDGKGKPLSSPLGAGHHMVVAYNKTGSKVSFLGVGTLARVRVPVAELTFAEPVAFSPRRLAAGLDRRRKRYKRHGRRFAENTVKELVAALRAGA